ncbi:MAG TPA: HAD family hydrolase [Polyangia bacterium]|nr:HAD family hydrolase [Polyangia bacterium]
MRLLLFDIDGTLLRAHGIGARAMERAGRRVLGAAFTLDGIDFGGALDPWIFREAATRLGHDDPSEFHAAFRDEYLVELPLELARAETPPEILPGVAAALATIGGDATATLGLVTGNYARAVPLKLRAVGIDPAQFVIGAFGDDAPTRPELVRLAIDRWRAQGAHPDPDRVVVIGDTPRDVDCARKNGCRSVAVATGWHAVSTLDAAGADVVIRDLTELPQALATVWP